ncbi:hypothetical protein C8R44DRAFT_744257 [Mycena epipterygia]|nr:hypothetical protein C8R44DRAFT_744257 [Mycena epipterygia]
MTSSACSNDIAGGERGWAPEKLFRCGASHACQVRESEFAASPAKISPRFDAAPARQGVYALRQDEKIVHGLSRDLDRVANLPSRSKYDFFLGGLPGLNEKERQLLWVWENDATWKHPFHNHSQLDTLLEQEDRITKNLGETGRILAELSAEGEEIRGSNGRWTVTFPLHFLKATAMSGTVTVA